MHATANGPVVLQRNVQIVRSLRSTTILKKKAK